MKGKNSIILDRDKLGHSWRVNFDTLRWDANSRADIASKKKKKKRQWAVVRTRAESLRCEWVCDSISASSFNCCTTCVCMRRINAIWFFYGLDWKQTGSLRGILNMVGTLPEPHMWMFLGVGPKLTSTPDRLILPLWWV